MRCHVILLNDDLVFRVAPTQINTRNPLLHAVRRCYMEAVGSHALRSVRVRISARVGESGGWRLNDQWWTMCDRVLAVLRT